MNQNFRYNQAIVDKLQELIKKYPDLRFGQILVDFGIIKCEQKGDILVIDDPFYEESETTWKRMLDNKFCFKK